VEVSFKQKQIELYELKDALIYIILSSAINNSGTGLSGKGDAQKYQGLHFWNNLISKNEPTSIDSPGADSTVAMSSVAISNNKFQKKGESWRYHPEREPDRGQNKRKCEGWIDKEDNQCGHCGEMGHFPAYCPRMA